MKQTLQFSVMGADNDIHTVSIERDANNSINLRAMCSCGDAASGICDHRFSILECDTANVLSANPADVNILRDWIKGSDIDVAMRNLSKAKTELKLAHEKVARARELLARRMMD